MQLLTQFCSYVRRKIQHAGIGHELHAMALLEYCIGVAKHMENVMPPVSHSGLLRKPKL